MISVSKKLITLIKVEIDLPEEQNNEKILNEYKHSVYDLIRSETDDNAEITVTVTVTE